MHIPPLDSIRELPWHDDLRQDPLTGGWDYDPPPTVAGTGMWLRPAVAESHGIVAANNGRWVTPLVQSRPFGYLRLRFRARADKVAYWAGKHFAADGRMLDADHYSTFGPSEAWTDLTAYVRPPPDTIASCLLFEPTPDSAVRIAEVGLAPATSAEVAAWIGQCCRSLEPLSWVPPANRWDALPRLQRRLGEGGRLRLVMLGDSVINDVSNSLFETVLEQQYAGTAWDVVTSVRGSTGCDYYARPEILHDTVLRHQPDLVIIGGVSNGPHLEATRQAVREIKRVTEADIVLMTEAFGKLDPRHVHGWNGAIPPPDSYRERLRQLADDEQVAWMDMAGALGTWLEEAELDDWSPIKRDLHHANQRGRMLASLIMCRFFRAD